MGVLNCSALRIGFQRFIPFVLGIWNGSRPLERPQTPLEGSVSGSKWLQGRMCLKELQRVSEQLNH